MFICVCAQHAACYGICRADADGQCGTSSNGDSFRLLKGEGYGSTNFGSEEIHVTMRSLMVAAYGGFTLLMLSADLVLLMHAVGSKDSIPIQ